MENCYNITSGGDGGDTNLGKKQSKEWIEKRMISRSDYVVTDETRKKQSIAHLNHEPWNKGKKMSEEYCENCRERSKGNKNHLGHKATDEQRLHMSISHIGKTLSETTKQKLSKSSKGRVGINNGVKNIKVLPQFLDEYLNCGWTIGWMKKKIIS